jgi:hypothetical protein
MGSFITNVQVRTADRDGLIARVRAFAGEGHNVVVGPVGEGGWIAIYDEATEDQDTRKLVAHAAAVSSANQPDVTVLVHDSDVLELSLVRGKLVDTFNSNPGYFEGTDPPRTGRPSAWADALAAGATVFDLARVWKADKVFAEEFLDDLAPLFGWDAERVRQGYRSLEDREGCTVLGGVAPAAAPARATGKPAFHGSQTGPRIAGNVGDAITIRLNAGSISDPGVGLELRLSGRAIDDGLLVIDSARAWTGLPTEPVDGVVDGTTCGWPGFVIPSGSLVPPPMSLANMDAVMQAQRASLVIVQVVGRALTAGQSKLTAQLIPAGNPDGRSHVTLDVDIRPAGEPPPERIPRRYR